MRDLDIRYQELTTIGEHRIASLAADCRAQWRQLYSIIVGEREEARNQAEVDQISLQQQQEALIPSYLELAED